LNVHSTTTLTPTAATTQVTNAHSIWGTSIRFTLLATLLCGIAYPLVITGIASLLFPHQAGGSLILKDGQVIGSELLAQSFTSDRYFHPRPSAAGNGYDATSSGGSNLAQSNAKLVQRMQGDIDKLAAANAGKPVPIDLVTTSGSGLDPDITPDAAFYQVTRVAHARGLNENQVRLLVQQHITGRQMGILGEPRVNVLTLNLDLDKMAK
jgi:potassium-transporting ATPase KdpC subunit